LDEFGRYSSLLMKSMQLDLNQSHVGYSGENGSKVIKFQRKLSKFGTHDILI